MPKIRMAKRPGGLGPESVSPVSSLCCLRYLLFNPLRAAVLAGASLLSAYEGMKQREEKIPADGKPRLKETLPLLRSKFEVRRFKVRSSPLFPPIRVLRSTRGQKEFRKILKQTVRKIRHYYMKGCMSLAAFPRRLASRRNQT